MGLIIKPTPITGDKGTTTVRALFDTGAVSSFLRREIAQTIGTIVATPTALRFTIAEWNGTLEVGDVITLDIVIGDVTVFFTVFVVDELAEEIVVGADMLQRWRIRLDPEQEQISVDPQVLRLRL